LGTLYRSNQAIFFFLNDFHVNLCDAKLGCEICSYINSTLYYYLIFIGSLKLWISFRSLSLVSYSYMLIISRWHVFISLHLYKIQLVDFFAFDFWKGLTANKITYNLNLYKSKQIYWNNELNQAVEWPVSRQPTALRRMPRYAQIHHLSSNNCDM
jgi:hypothetical protein